jgi:hypothetical protein
MNFKKYLLALSVLITFFHLSASAQRDTMSLNTIIAKTNKFTHEHPFEKVYLHMDKPYYSVGDTIWFKAYVTVGLHQPSVLSKVMYIDVVSERDTLVQALKLQVFNGVAIGSIPLTQALYKQGNYHLSAYTNWMRNFEPEYFFNKTIAIGNPIDNQVITNVSFSGYVKSKQQKFNARILFKDAVGNPYANKKVTWTIDNDDDKPLKGKETTDANGYLNLNITSTKSPILNTNSLVTVLDLGNKKLSTNTFPLRTAIATADMQFFPEGGDLISGIRTRVAFKAIKPNGLGADVKGTIVDNAGTVVSDFKSQNLGMGAFIFVPEDGKTYKAHATFADGSQNTFDLPAAKSTGIALSVYNNNPDTLSLKVTANNAFFVQNQNQPIYVIAQSAGYVCYAAQTTLASPVFTASILKSKFPSGIVQLTLFLGSEPLSERIVFIQNSNDGLNLTMNAGRGPFIPRGQVKMQVTAKNKNQPVEASLSVAVIDETKVPYNEDAETTILTSLLLSSDLKGYIEKPNYYFNHPTEKTATDLDVLMLTQGYRRFLYKDVLNNVVPRISFLPEQGMDITGTLRTLSGMPVAKGNIRLQIPDRNFSEQTTTNMSGEFKFAKLVIPDSSKVILNARNNVSNNNLMIMVDGTSLQGLSKNFNAPDEILNIDSALYPYMQNTKRQYNNSHTLKEVEIKDKLYVKRAGYQDFPSLSGLSFADHTLDGERLKDCPDFAMCLQTMLIGFTFDNNNFYVTRDYNNGKKTPAAIFFNGMPVDYYYLANINSAEVDNVESFFTDGVSSINRMYSTNGVIEITTKKAPVGTKVTRDQLADLFPPKYMATLMPKGYNISREFYSPKYTGPATVTQRADLRTTVYWNPRLITDKATGATTFDFFNTDSKGTYKAVVEGIDADGNIGRFVYRYKVQ